MDIHIDKNAFDKNFNQFITFIVNKSREDFNSFSSNSYTLEQEGYKYEIYDLARKTLNYHSWTAEDIGSGKIYDDTIEALKVKNNNLVNWRLVNKYIDKSMIRTDIEDLEKLLYDLYLNKHPEGEIFTGLVNTIGANYGLIAYLFFIKDKQRFLPISTTNFDKAFGLLGVDNFTTAKNCTWENYQTYLILVDETSLLLREKNIPDVTLLDAHSFLWIISNDLEKEVQGMKSKDWIVPPLTRTMRVTIVRVGQELFRKKTLLFWNNKSSISGLDITSMLIAAHIKPFSVCNDEEGSDIYNSLLLTPTEHDLFDLGLIGFRDDGQMLISRELTDNQIELLSLSKDFRLQGIEDGHTKYLRYHREHIFRS